MELFIKQFIDEYQPRELINISFALSVWFLVFGFKF